MVHHVTSIPRIDHYALHAFVVVVVVVVLFCFGGGRGGGINKAFLSQLLTFLWRNNR